MGSRKPVRESRDVSPRGRHFHILARSRRFPPPLASVRQSAPPLFRALAALQCAPETLEKKRRRFGVAGFRAGRIF